MGNVQQQVGKRMVIGRFEVEAVQYLGEGGSSFIFLVKDVRAPPTAKPLVLKRLVAHNEQTAEWIASEVRLHQRLNHPQVVQFVASQTNKPRGDKSEVFILMEYCPGGHLQENMLKMGTKRFAQHELLRTFKSLCEPVAVLHAQKPPIAHRDLKLENFLLDKEGVYKLCDFGSCVVGPQSLATKADRMRELDNVSKRTTAMYRSPELADVEGTAMFGSGELTEAVDVWAMGCILYSMAFFKSPFPLEGLRTDRYTIPSNSPYSPDVHAIIARMLTADVEKRATIEHIMDCIDEVICGRPLPLLAGPSPKKSEKSKSDVATPGLIPSNKKTESRKESIASNVSDGVDLLNMDFNPTISSNKATDSKLTTTNTLDTTWATADNFANFASFPSPTGSSQTSNSVFASGSATCDPFAMPSTTNGQAATSTSSTSVFDFDASPASVSAPVSSMKSHAPEIDPFAEIDAPPPALLYGGMPGQRMGQQQMGQFVGQPQMGFQQPQQMPSHMWGGPAKANQGYHSSNPF
ncbi:nak bike protein kinase [Plasmopara halstedii]|uniref:non-specific serine/threonine protein kinase n=1 Tax=Plasmopara halstedii TaxID=4781 RepID=A0A0P1AMP1_PLAHL|nr:nak bike protein kinase [Plasmopara halstedii]CEG42054.1 nak bike protein kinase [Plasmopara halstedii]|eukprot:XP_024578423.1 nak bike protein kinase [Plasmopara halstedii]